MHLSKRMHDCEAFFRETTACAREEGLECALYERSHDWSLLGQGSHAFHSWAFPETSLGAIYVLKRLSSEDIGLSLAFTDEHLNKVHCFYLEISTHTCLITTRGLLLRLKHPL